MYYFYINIVEECKVIIHLCNMLHEVKRKYNLNPLSKVDNIFHNDQVESSQAPYDPMPALNAQDAHEKFLQRQLKEQKKRERERKKQRKQFMKFGVTTPAHFLTTKKSDFPLHYGWSIEQWR
ncbi:unnamed protein product [Leptidea sinapis]|nr:unnamed protein product [Leptidea sinapis]